MPKTAKKNKRRMSAEGLFPREPGALKENAAATGAKKGGKASSGAKSVLSPSNVLESVVAALSPKAMTKKNAPSTPGLPAGPCKARAKVVDIEISDEGSRAETVEATVEDVAEATPLSPRMQKFMTTFDPPSPNHVTDTMYRDAHEEISANAAIEGDLVGLPYDYDPSVSDRSSSLVARTKERCNCFPLWRL